MAEAGGTLVAVESYDRSAAALTGAARRLANGGAMDAVLIADSGGNAIRAVPIINLLLTVWIIIYLMVFDR